MEAFSRRETSSRSSRSMTMPQIFDRPKKKSSGKDGFHGYSDSARSKSASFSSYEQKLRALYCVSRSSFTFFSCPYVHGVWGGFMLARDGIHGIH